MNMPKIITSRPMVAAMSMAVSLIISTSVEGAIAVTQAQDGYSGSDPFSAAFDVQDPNSVLVVGLYVDDADGSRTPTNPRFGDGGGIGSGDVAPDASYNSDRMNMFIFLNPSTASGLQFRIDNSASVGGYTAAIWEISGVQLNTGTFTVSTSTSITTDTADELVISIAGVNGNAASITYNSGSDIDSGSVIGGDNAPGAGGMLGGTIAAATPGTYDVSWTGTGEGQIAVAFEAVPEAPSVTLDDFKTSDSVSENVAIGTVVGVLDTVVTDSWTPPITFSFNGGTDDASFSIADSTNLVTAEVFDRETKSSHTIDIRATDSAGTPNTTNTEFTITIDDVSEPGGAMYAVGEVAVASTLAGTFQTLLASGDSSVTYGVTAGTHHGSLFEISGASSNELHLKTAATGAQLNDEYFVEVTASGDSTGAYDPMLLKITVVSSVSTGSVFRFR